MQMTHKTESWWEVETENRTIRLSEMEALGFVNTYCDHYNVGIQVAVGNGPCARMRRGYHLSDSNTILPNVT